MVGRWTRGGRRIGGGADRHGLRGGNRGALGNQGGHIDSSGGFGPFGAWQGEAVAIAASGPSQNEADLTFLRGRARLVVINETWRLASWADALYACDGRWHRIRGPSAEEFGGLRVQGHVAEREELHPGCLWGGVIPRCNDMILDKDGIGSGGNSGFQALNLVAKARPRLIILLGYDMGWDVQSHWHADHGSGLSNPPQNFLASCARILDRAALQLHASGIRVVNASRRSALKRFPMVALDQLEKEGLL